MTDGTEGGNWCLIESDPGVFTELVEKFGVEGVQFEEIYSLEKSTLDNIKPVFGLIFLFKWVKDENPQGTLVKDSRLEDIFFAKQVINNVCATQAILSCLLNVDHPEVKLGKILSGFKEFTASFDCKMKGLALSNSEDIRSVHNSFSRQSVFEFDQKMANKDDDVFHFVSYVPIRGRLYELDGLREGPVDHCKIPEGADWLDYAKPVIEQRIAKYKEGEIHFNLMAVVQNKLVTLKKQLDALTTVGDQTGIADTRLRIAEEEDIRARWHKENTRRRHNYLPFIVELLKYLAANKQLVNIYDKAHQKAVEKQKEQAATGATMDTSKSEVASTSSLQK